jgi:hypothetical protein
MNEDDEGIRFHTLPRRCIVVVEFRRRRGRRRLCSWAAALGIRGGLQGEGVAQLQGVPRRAGGQGKGAALLMAAALHRSRAQGGRRLCRGAKGGGAPGRTHGHRGRAKARKGGAAAGGRAGGGAAGGPREEMAAQGRHQGGDWRSWWSCAAPGRDAGR